MYKRNGEATITNSNRRQAGDAVNRDEETNRRQVKAKHNKQRHQRPMSVQCRW